MFGSYIITPLISSTPFANRKAAPISIVLHQVGALKSGIIRTAFSILHELSSQVPQAIYTSPSAEFPNCKIYIYI
jgi:hypothetical protein